MRLRHRHAPSAVRKALRLRPAGTRVACNNRSMSQDRSERVHDGTDRAALSVLRGIWAARGHSAAELGDGWVSNAKACKNSAALGLPDLDDDLRAAWRARLEREGKIVPGASSVGDLVRGAGEPRAHGAQGPRSR